MPRTNSPQIVPAQLRNQQFTDHAGQPLRVAPHAFLRKHVPVLRRDVGTAWLYRTEGTHWFEDLIATTSFIVSIHTRKNTTSWSLLTSPGEWDLLWLYRGEQVIPLTFITYTTLSPDDERNLIAAWLLRHPLFYADATRSFVDFALRNRFFGLTKRDFSELAALKETTLHYYLKQLRGGGAADPTINTGRQRITEQPAEKISVPTDEPPAQITGEGVAADAGNPVILPSYPLETDSSQPGEKTFAGPDNATSEGLTIAAGLIVEQDLVVHDDTHNETAAVETQSFVGATTRTQGPEGLPPRQAQDETLNPVPAVSTPFHAVQDVGDHALDSSQLSDGPGQPDQSETCVTDQKRVDEDLVSVQPPRSTASQGTDDSRPWQLPLFVDVKAA